MWVSFKEVIGSCFWVSTGLVFPIFSLRNGNLGVRRLAMNDFGCFIFILCILGCAESTWLGVKLTQPNLIFLGSFSLFSAKLTRPGGQVD